MKDTPETLHARLRIATRALHDDLERAVAIERQITSKPRFAAYLVRLWGLHSAIDAALDGVDLTALGLDYSSDRRTKLLETDLAHFGVPRERLLQNALPVMSPVKSPEAALGCIYVVEGSALGARAMLPQIHAALGLDPAHGVSYFAGLGEEGKALWRACLIAINGIPPDTAAADQVVEAARQTFALFRTWLPERAATTTLDPVPLT